MTTLIYNNCHNLLIKYVVHTELAPYCHRLRTEADALLSLGWHLTALIEGPGNFFLDCWMSICLDTLCGQTLSRPLGGLFKGGFLGGACEWGPLASKEGVEWKSTCTWLTRNEEAVHCAMTLQAYK